MSEVSASLYESHVGQSAPPLLFGFHSVLVIFAFLCLVETSLYHSFQIMWPSVLLCVSRFILCEDSSHVGSGPTWLNSTEVSTVSLIMFPKMITSSATRFRLQCCTFF